MVIFLTGKANGERSVQAFYEQIEEVGTIHCLRVGLGFLLATVRVASPFPHHGGL